MIELTEMQSHKIEELNQSGELIMYLIIPIEIDGRKFVNESILEIPQVSKILEDIV